MLFKAEEEANGEAKKKEKKKRARNQRTFVSSRVLISILYNLGLSRPCPVQQQAQQRELASLRRTRFLLSSQPAFSFLSPRWGTPLSFLKPPLRLQCSVSCIRWSFGLFWIITCGDQLVRYAIIYFI